MKNLLLILLFLISTSTVFAQTKADYETAIAQFQHYYNYQRADSICGMFAKKSNKQDTCLFIKDRLKLLTDQYGYMRSCTWLMQKDRVTLFKTQFIRSTHIMAVTLNKENKFEKFVFKITTGNLDSLVSKK
jgi:transcription termination factor Rho